MQGPGDTKKEEQKTPYTQVPEGYEDANKQAEKNKGKEEDKQKKNAGADAWEEKDKPLK